MKCERCKSDNATRYRQNTQYEDDELNFVVLCDECKAINDEHWDAMWKEYYGEIKCSLFQDIGYKKYCSQESTKPNMTELLYCAVYGEGGGR